jgi:predicted HTH domain antitoxin
MATVKKQQGKKARKYGREKRKKERRNSPISLFVKGKISFAEYLRLCESK